MKSKNGLITKEKSIAKNVTPSNKKEVNKL